jgi:hypothetical protein
MRIRSSLSRSIAVASTVVAIAAVGCSTQTTETNVWKNPTYAAGPMKNIAVFGGRMNETDRRTLEDGFVSALSAYGVHATPSYAILPEGEATPPDPAAIRAKLQSTGYEGALVSKLEGVSERVTVMPDADWGAGFYGAYWGQAAPVYAQTDQFVKFETTLWSATGGKMLWSTTTQTENPTSGKDFVSSLTRTVVPSLSKAGLIPPGRSESVSLLR